MGKYRVYGIVTGSKYLGIVDAETEMDAINKAFELDACYVSLCHQCSSEADGAEIHEIQAELDDD